jgi:hypothetical protein
MALSDKHVLYSCGKEKYNAGIVWFVDRRKNAKANWDA